MLKPWHPAGGSQKKSPGPPVPEVPVVRMPGPGILYDSFIGPVHGPAADRSGGSPHGQCP